MRRIHFLLAGVLLIPTWGCSKAPTHTPVTSTATTPPTCGGGAGAPQGTMSGKELTLANLINSYRRAPGFGQGPVGVPPNAVNVGVAQWHVRDMDAHDYVGLVGWDGEDVFRRIVCSNGAPGVSTGVIAVGYSTDPQAVFEALQTDPGSIAIIGDATKKTSLSVGYRNGYWLIILQ